jgi:hypothetical protein
MEFVKTQIDDPKQLKQLLDYVAFSALVFLSANPRKIKQRLKEKVMRGASKNPSPNYDLYDIKRKCEDDMLGLVVWTLLERYNKMHEKQIRTKSP